MNKIIMIAVAFIFLGGCSQPGLEGKYVCDGMSDNIEVKSDGLGYMTLMGQELAFEYKIDEDRFIIAANGQSHVLRIKDNSLVGSRTFGTCASVTDNPILGQWDTEYEENKEGEIKKDSDGEDYIKFFPSKLIFKDKKKKNNVVVRSYDIDDENIIVTIENLEGEIMPMQFQLLDDDRLKMVLSRDNGAVFFHRTDTR